MSLAFDMPQEVRLPRADIPFAKVTSPPPAKQREVNLKALEDELSRNRLSEIAQHVRALTYGEMMELAKGIWDLRPSEVLPLTEENLPMVLHLWSVSQKAKVYDGFNTPCRCGHARRAHENYNGNCKSCGCAGYVESGS